MAAEGFGGKAVLIAGPTASGKSPLALALAERRNGAVINADSMQVYRELRVLTARPGPDDEARAPHRLYGAVSIAEPFSAARWRAAALAAIAEARAAGRLPILVGGSGFYLKALTEGLVELPPIPEAVRAAARRRARELSARDFHAEIAARDPAAARRIGPNDFQRLARAWEVHEATGRALSDWQADKGEGAMAGEFHAVLLDPPRERVRQAASARLAAMVAGGALDEARAVGHLDLALPGMRALGLRELLAAVRGECSVAEAMLKAEHATHRYIKRQTTWFRHQMRFGARFEDWRGALAALVGEDSGAPSADARRGRLTITA